MRFGMKRSNAKKRSNAWLYRIEEVHIFIQVNTDKRATNGDTVTDGYHLQRYA